MKAWAIKQGKYHYVINASWTRDQFRRWKECEEPYGKIIRVRITEIKPRKRMGKI